MSYNLNVLNTLNSFFLEEFSFSLKNLDEIEIVGYFDRMANKGPFLDVLMFRYFVILLLLLL